MKEYLSKLNQKQYEACVDTEGPSLIIAGAGSGKTRVLTNRIAYMINECGINPHNILAITFTNKAAREMNERLVQTIGEDAKSVTCKTFHSFSALLLRREIEILPGRKRTFQIVDDDESEALIRESMNELNYDTKLIKPKTMATDISLIKSEINTFDSYSDYVREKIEATMNRYNEKLLKNNLLDFDDLLRLVLEVFRREPSILDKYQERYKYILVDEFQDSSNIQYEFVSMLGEKYQNVFIVGDEDQSIYSFRGANIENIKKFMKEFKGYHQHILDQNYRSAPEILEVSNKLIEHNQKRIKKSLWTDREKGDGVKLKFFDGDKTEARFISTTIDNAVSSGKYKYQDFAILYRNNYLSRNFENELIDKRIPYRVYSGLSFYKRKEVKDMLGYLRLVLDTNDFFSFQRVIKSPSRGIGDTTIKKIENLFLESGSLKYALENVQVSPSHKDILNTFMITIETLRNSFESMSLNDFIMSVYEKCGYKQYIDEIEDEDERESRKENIDELFTAISEVEVIGSVEDTLSEFLQNVSLLTDSDLESDNPNHVALITMHSAKGLEYPNVFAVALEDDIIPGMRALEANDVEEERRLLYVCLTRAKDNLYISCATSRFKFGQTINAKPSRFLKELGIEDQDTKRKAALSALSFQSNREKKAPAIGDMKPGDRVFHTMNGEGTVKGQVEGFYIIKFDKKPAPMKVIVGHPLLKKIS